MGSDDVPLPLALMASALRATARDGAPSEALRQVLGALAAVVPALGAVAAPRHPPVADLGCRWARLAAAAPRRGAR